MGRIAASLLKLGIVASPKQLVKACIELDDDIFVPHNCAKAKFLDSLIDHVNDCTPASEAKVLSQNAGLFGHGSSLRHRALMARSSHARLRLCSCACLHYYGGQLTQLGLLTPSYNASYSMDTLLRRNLATQLCAFP